MASKAQLQMLLNSGPKPAAKKKQPAKGGSLAAAAQRKLQNLKKGQNKNNGIGHSLDTPAIDAKEAQMRAQKNGNH